jgi:hypothetical protein
MVKHGAIVVAGRLQLHRDVALQAGARGRYAGCQGTVEADAELARRDIADRSRRAHAERHDLTQHLRELAGVAAVEHDDLHRLPGSVEHRAQHAAGHLGRLAVIVDQADPVRTGVPYEVHDGWPHVAERAQQIERPSRKPDHEAKCAAPARAPDLVIDRSHLLIELKPRGHGWVGRHQQDVLLRRPHDTELRQHSTQR